MLNSLRVMILSLIYQTHPIRHIIISSDSVRLPSL